MKPSEQVLWVGNWLRTPTHGFEDHYNSTKGKGEKSMRRVAPPKGSSLSVACCCSPSIGESCRHMTSPGLRETGKCSPKLDSHVPATTLAREEGTDCGGELLHKE